MSMTTVVFAIGTVASGSLAAAGWGSPTGLAAFLTALVGAGAFIWSVFQGLRRKREIDLDAAREFVRLMQEAKHDDH